MREFLAVAWLILLSSPRALLSQDSNLSQELRTMAALEAQNANNLSSLTAGGEYSTHLVTVERGPRLGSDTPVWRVWALNKPYLIVQSGARLYRAGGFGYADPIELAGVLSGGSGCSAGAGTLAGCLALMLDPLGAVGALSLADADTSARLVLAAWRKSRPDDWPRDTVRVGALGDTIVVRTVLSRTVMNFGAPWGATVHSFDFYQGKLIAYATRKGPLFPGPE